MSRAPCVLYRFAHDLRLDDHAGLAAACALGEVVGVLVLDRQIVARLVRSPRRAAAYCAAVQALDSALRRYGSHLVVRRGNVGTTLREVARGCGASAVAWSASYEYAGRLADQHLQSILEEAGLRALLVHDAPVIAPEDADLSGPDGRGYRAFAGYYERWQRLILGRDLSTAPIAFSQTVLHSEPLPSAQEFGACAQIEPIAEEEVAANLAAFLVGPALQYAVTAKVPASDGTSRLGADLSLGRLAARRVVRETLARLSDPFLLAEERASLGSFLRALARRDFFLQLAWYAEGEDRALQEEMRDFLLASDHPGLSAWLEGRTGFPLVDAGMRELRLTGWMHPRVRPVAASFLCFDLGVDWRIGRDLWERWLIEDDPALATGNWQWAAGVGADLAQVPRIYDPERQRRRVDPEGRYVSRYVDELAGLPVGAWVGRPAGASQLELDLFGPVGYPKPILDHQASAHAYLARYRAYRRERAGTT
ncbi:MAG: FAD-binding domain-containing protein [Vulcanimicrobiaceae bacterium]